MNRVIERRGAWDYRKYGTLTDPVHKSHMSYWTGQFACAQQFRRMREDPESPLREAGMSASLGTAGHALIALILDSQWGLGTDHGTLTRWIARAVPAAAPEDHAETAAMVLGLLADLPQWVKNVIAVESGFIARFGEYWLAGHLDLIYEPVAAPGTVAIC